MRRSDRLAWLDDHGVADYRPHAQRESGRDDTGYGHQDGCQTERGRRVPPGRANSAVEDVAEGERPKRDAAWRGRRTSPAGLTVAGLAITGLTWRGAVRGRRSVGRAGALSRAGRLQARSAGMIPAGPARPAACSRSSRSSAALAASGPSPREPAPPLAPMVPRPSTNPAASIGRKSHIHDEPVTGSEPVPGRFRARSAEQADSPE